MAFISSNRFFSFLPFLWLTAGRLGGPLELDKNIWKKNKEGQKRGGANGGGVTNSPVFNQTQWADRHEKSDGKFMITSIINTQHISTIMHLKTVASSFKCSWRHQCDTGWKRKRESESIKHSEDSEHRLGTLSTVCIQMTSFLQSLNQSEFTEQKATNKQCKHIV